MGNFSETPLMEVTLRRYESPHNLTQRDTLKKICLSLGLLQPGDTRDIIVDILLVLEHAKSEKQELNASEIKDQLIDIRKQHGLSINGTAASNIRRQLKRLRDIFLVEKVKNNYRILEFMNLKEIFEQKIQKIILEAVLLRNEDYFNYYKTFENNKGKEKNEKQK
ncbi:MAG: hypothetical protein ACOC16_01505 [Nanoarchaeota archaeon]